MVSFKIVFLNILIFCMKHNVTLGVSKEKSFLPVQYFYYNKSNERISKSGFKKEWLPIDFCKSGLPLLKNRFCNGKIDCLDGSDETVERCRSNNCNPDNFRCNYGGCITKTLVCNGIYHCADGSDEDQEICRATNCKIPYPTKDTVYFVSDCDECQSGSRVKEGSILKHQCINDATLKEDSNDVICRNGMWSPTVPYCEGIKQQSVPNANEIPTTSLAEKLNKGKSTTTASTSTEKSNSSLDSATSEAKRTSEKISTTAKPTEKKTRT